MTNLKHIGIYVKDMDVQRLFYEKCFNMKVIQDALIDKGILYDEIFGVSGIEVLITKLITEYGSISKQGEMIELIKISSILGQNEINRKISDFGISHLSFGVDDIENTKKTIVKYKGNIITNTIKIGLKYCCFCNDPEGNVIELIQ